MVGRHGVSYDNKKFKVLLLNAQVMPCVGNKNVWPQGKWGHPAPFTVLALNSNDPAWRHL